MVKKCWQWENPNSWGVRGFLGERVTAAPAPSRPGGTRLPQGGKVIPPENLKKDPKMAGRERGGQFWPLTPGEKGGEGGWGSQNPWAGLAGGLWPRGEGPPGWGKGAHKPMREGERGGGLTSKRKEGGKRFLGFLFFKP